MKNHIKHYFGYFKWRIYFYFTSFNYSVSKQLNKHVENGIESGIEVYNNSDDYYFKILFNNGLYMESWNENKYYAWAVRGTLLNENFEYKWDGRRLTTKNLSKLLYQIEQYEKSH